MFLLRLFLNTFSCCSTGAIGMSSWTYLLAVLAVLGPLVAAQSTHGDEQPNIQCYECTSYMTQCKERVDHSLGYVYSMGCKSNCFVRINEDGATYRGCADHFADVKGLDLNYVGCRNITWNNREVPWCVCDTNLCNEMSMDDLHIPESSYGQLDVYDNVYSLPNRDANTGYYDDTKATENNNIETSESYPNDQYYYDLSQRKTGGSALSSSRSYMDHFAREGPQDSQYTESNPSQEEPFISSSMDAYNQYQPQKAQAAEYQNEYQTKGNEDSSMKGNFDDSYQSNSPYSTNSGHYGSEDADYYPYHQEQTGYSGLGEKALKTTEDIKSKPDYVSSKLAAKIQCLKTGYYQNPNDCSQFVACLMDPYSKTPIMHVMTCPEGLVWDNKMKICMEYSTTCSNGANSDYVNADRHGIHGDNTVEENTYNNNYNNDKYSQGSDFQQNNYQSESDEYNQVAQSKQPSYNNNDKYSQSSDHKQNSYQSESDEYNRAAQNKQPNYYSDGYYGNDGYQNNYDSKYGGAQYIRD